MAPPAFDRARFGRPAARTHATGHPRARRVAPLVAAGLAIALGAARPAVARADGSWVVVVTQGDDNRPPASVLRAAEHTSEAMRERGWSALSPRDSARRFEARASIPAASEELSDAERAGKLSERLKYLVATERYRQAERVSTELMKLAERLRDSTGYSARVVRELFEGCLYRVKAAVQRNDRAAARAMAAECRRLAPYERVEPTTFPPSVVGVMAEVDAELGHLAREVRIDSRPEGCAIHLNGYGLEARTPTTMKKLIPGEYAIRIDCGEHGQSRIHRTTVARDPIELVVDVRFEQAVHTADALWLGYPDEPHHDRWRLPHAVQVGRALGASDVVLLTAVGDGAIRLDRASVAEGRVVASVRSALDDGGRPAHMARAMGALGAERSVELGAEGGRPIEPWTPPERAEVAPQPTGRAAAGAKQGTGTPAQARPGPDAAGGDGRGGTRGAGHLAGATALGAVGLAGVGIGLAGIIRGGCHQVDPATDDCLRGPGRTNWGAVALWGGLGVLALATASAWLTWALTPDTNGAGAEVGIGPAAVRLRGRF